MNKIAEKAIGSAGAAVRALNPHLFPASGQLPPASNPQVECAKQAKGRPLVEVFANECKPAKRIRQDSKPLLNKLESSFLAVIQATHPNATIWKQALRWKLGNGIWYKPDFVWFEVAFPFSGAPAKIKRLVCCEVKGPHAFRGGFENLKVAASLYPEVRWILVWKSKGSWQQQEVLP